MFFKQFTEGIQHFPVPTHKELPRQYVTQCRKRFHLRPDDGVSDKDFYSR